MSVGRGTARRDAARALALATLLAGVAAACVSERSDAGPSSPTSGACLIAVGSPVIGATQALVAIRDYAFVPDTVRVRAGTRVTWVNCEPPAVDNHTSTATLTVSAGGWASPPLASGDSYTHTFATAGTFTYRCLPHPFMQGVVVVE